jgi:hypothetical protein
MTLNVCAPWCPCKTPAVSPSADAPSVHVTPAVWPAPYPSGRRNYVLRNGKAVRLPHDPTIPSSRRG